MKNLYLFGISLLLSALQASSQGNVALSITSPNNGIPIGFPFSTATIVDDQIVVTGTQSITNPRVYIDNGYQSGDILSYTGSLPTGITASYSSGSLSFTGTAAASVWQDLFRRVTFRTTSGNMSDRTVRFVLGNVVSLMIDGKPHYYEYVKPGYNPTWHQARDLAAARTFFGMTGYLATVTSQAENDYIRAKLSSDGWLGGSDAETEGVWKWVTGPEAGTQFSQGSSAVNGRYANWASGEPNDSNGEDYLQLYSQNNGKWNDLNGESSNSVPGYVVEYGGYPNDPQINGDYVRTVKNKPAAPNIVSITDDTNVAGDFVTADSTLNISGTGPANATIKFIHMGVGQVALVSANASGNWSYNYGTKLSEGTHIFAATAIVGGIESDSSLKKTVTIDYTAPDAPVNEKVVGASGSYIKNNKPQITVEAELNSFVQIYVDGVFVTQVKAVMSDGVSLASYTFSTALSEGQHTLTFKAKDLAGNESAFGDALTFIVDTQKPATPGAPIIAEASNGYVNVNDPVISGTAEAGGKVTLYFGGNSVEITVGADGSWSYQFDPPLSDGAYSFTFDVTDAAGNTSSASPALNITVDTQEPAKPTVALTSNNNDGFVNTNQPTIGGDAEAGAAVKIIVNGNLLTTVTANAGGKWSYTFSPALADVEYEVVVTATDAAGNVSQQSDELAFTVDTQKPATPDAPAIAEANNGYVTVNDPVISGVAEPHSKIKLYHGGNTIDLLADADGNWTYHVPALSDGTYSFTFDVTDAAGNTSEPSAALTVTVDTQNPAAPSTTASGDINDGVSNNNRPTIGGQAEPNATIIFYLDGVEVGTVQADAHGNWTYTFTEPLSEGVHEIYTVAVDAAGNKSTPSAKIAFLVDTQEPVVPSFEFDEATNGFVSTSLPTLSGTAEPNALIRIYNNGVLVATVTADGDGNWSYTFTQELEDGEHNITVTATDGAGNTSPMSSPIRIKVDTEVPGTPSVPAMQGANERNLSKTNAPSLSGRGEPGTTITIYDNGVAVGTVVVDEDGNWSYTFNPALSDGDHTIHTTITDLAGNTSEGSEPYSFRVDTRLPEVTITAGESNAKGPFTVTFTFDEPVENFNTDKIMLHNAAASNLQKISDTEYRVLISPLSDKNVRVQLASQAATDFAGNGNKLSNLLTVGTTFSASLKDVYPVPANQVVNVRFDGVVSETCQVTLVKMSGQVVYTRQMNFNNNILTIDVSKLSTGVYTVYIKAKNESYQRQFIIAR